MRTLTVQFLVCAALFSCFACSSPEKPEMSDDPYVILYGEFMHEVNSFSPVITTERDFRADHLFYGEDVLKSAIEEDKQLAGFLEAVDKVGKGTVKAVPVIQAKSMSGGPVDSTFYASVKKYLIQAVTARERIDGIYLSMHGAMGVQGMFDPEGDIIKTLRDIVGKDVFIAVTFDLHSNVTKKRADEADIIVGYHTNPHRDHFRTGHKAGELLIRSVAGEIEPVMVVDKMNLLKGGGMNIDLLPPFRKIFIRMKKMELEEDVLSVSFFPVHIWIDEPELGYSTVAITDRKPELAEKLADEIAEMAWAVRDVPQPAGNTPEEAVRMAHEKKLARKLGTLVFCDASDAVGTGTPGESTWILKALLENGAGLTTYLTLRDAGATAEAWDYSVGDSVALNVGGKIDTVYNATLPYNGVITWKNETSFGKTVIVKHDGIHLIMSELPMASRLPADFKDLGLSLWKADIVVVKNLFPFRYNYLLYNRKTVNVMSPGLSNTDPFALNYVNIPRPIYPLDQIDSWR